MPVGARWVTLLGALSIVGCLAGRNVLFRWISQFDAATSIRAAAEPGEEKATTDEVSPFGVRAATADGTALANVKVFNGTFDRTTDHVAGFDDEGVLTNHAGVAMVKGPRGDVLLGSAPDGRVAVSYGGRTLSFGRVGTIRLKVTDAAGLPIRGFEVAVFPSKDAQPLQAVGWMDRGGPYSPDTGLMGKTDSFGRVQFRNLPVTVRFGVSLEVGPNSWMAFIGAEQPGRAANVVVSNNCELLGHVIDSNGRPVRGKTLYFGYLVREPDPGGYSGPTLRKVRTDRNGAYSVSGLPNIMLSVQGPTFYVDTCRLKRRAWSRNRFFVPELPGRTSCALLASTSH